MYLLDHIAGFEEKHWPMTQTALLFGVCVREKNEQPFAEDADTIVDSMVQAVWSDDAEIRSIVSLVTRVVNSIEGDAAHLQVFDIPTHTINES